jgi:GT2 family glycosyltransferase
MCSNKNMPVATHKIAIVIPTIGRCDELRKMLQSLAQQTRLPDQVVLVDEAGEGNTLAREFPALHISVTTFQRGSASAKRNRGVECVASEIELIGFMDDDIVLEPQAVEVMLDFWKNAPEDTGGASCNWMNLPPLFASRLKSLRFVSRWGLYDPRGSLVMRSGFQTIFRSVPENRYVQWLPSGGVVYPRRILQEELFDEWFQGYGFLEDLDFSYSVGKKHRLVIVAAARSYHYPSKIGRPDWYLFGKKEVINRLYFVSKHQEFSRPLCCLGLFVRMFLSTFEAVKGLEAARLKRVAGNLVGLALVVKGGLRRV